MDPQLKRLAIVLVALSGLDGSAALAESRPRYAGTVVGSTLGEPVSLDPALGKTHAEHTVAALIFDTLYRRGAGGAIEPHLAAGLPEPSEDPLELRVPIRAGVRFHDGTLMSVEDVAASLERVRSSASGWILSSVARVSDDGGELVIKLKYPTARLAEALSATATSITKRGRRPSRTRPVGTGAFRLARLSRKNRRLDLVAFEQHFAGRAYVGRLVLRWFERADAEARSYEAGKAELSFRGAVAFAGHTPKHPTGTVDGPATVLVYVGFGSAHPMLSKSVEFRRALSLALSRDSMRNLGSGERVVPTVSPAAEALGAAPTAKRDVQSKRSEALRLAALAAKKVAFLQKTPRPALSVLVDRSRPDQRSVAEKVVAALFRLGLRARITELDARSFQARVERGACDFYIGELAAPTSEPAVQIAAAFAAGRDSWAEKRLADGPLGARLALRAFRKRLPILPLYHRALRVHHRLDVRGTTFDSLTRLAFPELHFSRGTNGKP